MVHSVNIPKIGLGTWHIDNKKAEEVILEALKIGYRHIDTARRYNNEVGVGEGIKKSGVPREKIFVTTKLWTTDFLFAKTAFKKSLKRLDLDYVDLYLIHWPHLFWKSAWKSLESIHKSGQARSIGVSNFGIKELEAIKKSHGIVPAVNQIEISPFYYRQDLISYCQSNGILVEAYSPLTRASRLSDPKLQVIANKYQKTVAQVLLAWCLQHDFIVLPKATSTNHLKENFQSQKTIINLEDMNYLDSLNENYSALFRTVLLR